MSMTAIRRNLTPLTEYNILFLGQTGSGKSTTINALANYLKFSSFEEAENAEEFVQLIPTEFFLPDPEDPNEFTAIQFGDDPNEQTEPGKSCTQSTREYQFRFGNSLIRLIDTPGVGDTGGVAVDELNFDKLMSYLRKFDKLHGICIVLKANENRVTTEFKYCLNELLMHLHKDACKNIVVCFTYSRTTNYQPGQGMITLRNYLRNELHSANVELVNGENCFFIDNEAFNYLVAKKCNYPIPEDERELYKLSWNRSVEKSATILNKIISLSPHSLQYSLKLHEVRKLMFRMAEPMVRLQGNIDDNQTLISECCNPANNNGDRIALARRLLDFRVSMLQFKKLDYPRTVCTNIKCIDVVDLANGEKKIDYKMHCHPHCYLDNVQANIIADPKLIGCAAMDGHDYCVEKCGCPWQLHMHIEFEFEKITQALATVDSAQVVRTLDQAEQIIPEQIRKLESLSSEYQQERNTIQEIGIKFSHILNGNSTRSHNQFIEPYIELMIREETRKMSDPKYSRAKYVSLIEMQKQYKDSVKAFEESLRSGQQRDLDVNDVEELRDELFDLDHSGLLFQQILNGLKDQNFRSEYNFPEPVVQVY